MLYHLYDLRHVENNAQCQLCSCITFGKLLLVAWNGRYGMLNMDHVLSCVDRSCEVIFCVNDFIAKHCICKSSVKRSAAVQKIKASSIWNKLLVNLGWILDSKRLVLITWLIRSARVVNFEIVDFLNAVKRNDVGNVIDMSVTGTLDIVSNSSFIAVKLTMSTLILHGNAIDEVLLVLWCMQQHAVFPLNLLHLVFQIL